MSEDVVLIRRAAARHIIRHCGNLNSGEVVVVVCCEQTKDVADILVEQAKELTSEVRLFQIPSLKQHGQEPPSHVRAAMLEADLILGVTKCSMAHTKARIDAAEYRARYLSLADYTLDLLSDPSLTVDYRSRAPIVRAVADAFTNGDRVRVRTVAGTDIHLSAHGRTGNYCPGFVTGPGDLGSPPDIEANVSPVETESDGFVVVDGSIPIEGVGLLSEPVQLTVRDGSIVNIDGPPAITDILDKTFSQAGSKKALILAECGVGLNEKARLTGSMLTDEGAAGTMHFGFGSNATVGGKNDISFHMDFVFRNATLSIDDRLLIEDGRILV